jgi:hypothetical protein
VTTLLHDVVDLRTFDSVSLALICRALVDQLFVAFDRVQAREDCSVRKRVEQLRHKLRRKWTCPTALPGNDVIEHVYEVFKWLDRKSVV